jgi:hypothetical protein
MDFVKEKEKEMIRQDGGRFKGQAMRDEGCHVMTELFLIDRIAP